MAVHFEKVAVGFFEFYHTHDKKIAQFLDLSPMRKNSRGARNGFPLSLMNEYFWRLINSESSTALILEREYYWTGIKERSPAYRFESLTSAL